VGTYGSAFKKVFSDKRIFSEFIEAFVPALKDFDIDKKSLVLENTSFTDPFLSNRESDLCYKIKYKDNDIFLYITAEHQSIIDLLMSLRLLAYIIRLWERYIKDKKFRPPSIIPIVFYDGEESWNVPLNFEDKIANFNNIPRISERNIKNIYGYISKFIFELIELAKIKSGDLLKLQNALGLLSTFDSSTSEDLTYSIKKIRQAFKLLPIKRKRTFGIIYENFFHCF
jgi:predicted transposase/invertase (TIGR01784 family)